MIMMGQPTSRGNHHIECPLYGRTSYPTGTTCMCELIDRVIKQQTGEVGDKIVTKVVENCICGSVHDGDNWTIRAWRDEHNADHAERVIQMQKVVPYLPPYIEPYKITFGDGYYVPSITSDTVNSCGMSPLQRQDFDERQEAAASEAVQSKIMLLIHKVGDVENRIGG